VTEAKKKTVPQGFIFLNCNFGRHIGEKQRGRRWLRTPASSNAS
jgi:hypothetical protein